MSIHHNTMQQGTLTGANQSTHGHTVASPVGSPNGSSYNRGKSGVP